MDAKYSLAPLITLLRFPAMREVRVVELRGMNLVEGPKLAQHWKELVAECEGHRIAVCGEQEVRCGHEWSHPPPTGTRTGGVVEWGIEGREVCPSVNLRGSYVVST